MDLRLLDGKWFAVLMVAEAPSGEDEWAFFEGTATWDGKQLIIDRGSGNPPFQVPEDTLARIKAVDPKLRQVFERLRKTVVFVTHDMTEAAYVAGEIALMRAGRILQRGTLDDLMLRPADPFVTEFIRAQRPLDGAGHRSD